MEFVNKTKRLYVRPSNCDEKGKFAAVLVQGGSKREIVKRSEGQDGWPGVKTVGHICEPYLQQYSTYKFLFEVVGVDESILGG